MTARHRIALRPAGRYDLHRALLGHGWVDLPPHSWDAERGELATAVAVAGVAVDATVVQRGGAVRAVIEAPRPLSRNELGSVRTALRRALQLDVDLEPFWAVCRATPRLRWVARLAAGYLMQSPTLFEDLLKLLFTTNCSWAATKKMCERTVAGLGPVAPSGRRAFPGPAACAGAGVAFFRDEVRAGYRSPAAVELARRFAGGEVDEAWLRSAEPAEQRRRLQSLPGFGPYAAGHALRGLGCYEDLALDSWCRAKLTRIHGRRRSDAAIERAYRPFGPWRGLALWMDLTADWHRGQPAVEVR